MSRKRVVIKIGSSLLTHLRGQLDERRMARFVQEAADAEFDGAEVVLVSSGAIASGVGELRWPRRPTELARKQAAAAVGQVRLMERYRHYFSRRGVIVAQVLLTREDFASSKRYYNARATLLELMKSQVIPIINENDTVAVDEIRLGDNDTLAALVAIKVEADLLILLTDVDGLMTCHPDQGKGELIPVVERVTPKIEALADGRAGSRGTGGMITKLRAARLCSAHGIPVVIASGHKPGVLRRIINGEPEGTLFKSRHRPRKISKPIDKLLTNAL
jgi:glutamate 5-kinase